MHTSTPTIILLFQTLLASLLIAVVAAIVSIWFTRRIYLIDQPGSAPHKLHDNPVPLAGGIALIATLLIAEYFFGNFANKLIRASFIAALPVFAFGLWDDFRNLTPAVKLLGQLLAALFLIRAGIYIRIFESPEFFLHGTGKVYIYLDWLLTIVWVVGIANAFNFVDSMDGLLLGLGAIAASFFMLVTVDSQQLQLSYHSAIILGACIGLYFFNSSPALLFLGDSGAQTLGVFLAVLAIGYVPRGANQSSSWFVPIMLLIVPIFDACLVIISRLRHRRPVYLAGLDHTYHRLIKLGLAPNRAVLVMQGAALTLNCLAFLCLNQPPLIANLVFASVLCLGGVLLIFLDRRVNV
jgi:UDP-GlcNAc:undecaprenyl-phosphate/decaprenyl-phosphate GlcNAc-1-phosphate transferase